MNRSFYSRTLCRAFADLHGIGEENFNRLIKNRALINRLEWREKKPSFVKKDGFLLKHTIQC